MVTIRFSINDVLKFRPGWTKKEAREFLKRNQENIERDIYLAGLREIEKRLPKEKVRPGTCRGCMNGEACGFDPEKCSLAEAKDNGSGGCMNKQMLDQIESN